ncbi:hypothetical protein [Halalkalibacter okhensis]|uniref:Fimbrial assembly protein n=1 Tax=Halalkalibacter okhensis TaxID=333138 RepID=A0A0B0IMQ9_9BACI|nr:hypothetical protein [Halalkalibacter okhensis]KHF40946.1 hypothetical protein LQ50_06035 [Halalkalibacter okhensis]
MLVEINLLPEKQKRDITYPLISFIVLILVAVGTTALYFYQSSVKEETTQLREEIYAVQLESVQLTEQLQVKDDTGYAEYAQAVTVLEDKVIPTSLLVDELVSLLPERGFFLNFEYELPGEVKVEASFDQIEEVAAYYDALETSPVVSSVTLSVVDSSHAASLSNEQVLPRYFASFIIDIQTSEVRNLGESQ